MVEAKFYLTESQIAKTEETFDKFCASVQMNIPDPSLNLKSARRWDLFFGELGIVKSCIAAKPTVSVFLGFHSCESKYIITLAKSKCFILIGPDGT